MNLGQEIKTVLVTGGTGFAGGAVAQRLRSLGCMAFIRSSHNTIPLCYIDNLVDAVLLTLTSDRAVGQAYIVCDGPTVTWQELTDVLALQLDLPRVKLTVPLPAAKAAAVGAETWGHVMKSANRPPLTRYDLAFAGHNLRYSNAKICHNWALRPRLCPARAWPERSHGSSR